YQRQWRICSEILGLTSAEVLGDSLPLYSSKSFFQEEIHKILSPAVTRWLSLKSCVDRVIEQFQPLKAYLLTASVEDPSNTVDSMLAAMNNQFIYLYLEFMSYVLGMLTDFNVMFQSETPLLHRLRPEVHKMLQDLCTNYMDLNYIKNTPIMSIEHSNPRHFLQLEQIYLGIQATETFNELKKNAEKKDIEVFLKSILSFYVELVTQIKSRFDFSDEVFDVLSVLEPKSAQTFKVRSLAHVINRFPVLKKVVDVQKLDNQWKSHALLDFKEHKLDANESAMQYWKAVFSLKTVAGDAMFTEIQKVFNLLFILPFSNSSVERIFSELKHCKTNDRNKLKTETVVSLMGTREGIRNSGGCVKFEPTKEMLTRNIWQ
ncbi:uncharacterized protein LOC124375050, partial [Homalodisca vitripennis]|uniref:uncharacterized protein LOC124375050 n=1 Tax=Homalodisca vitripennis TaxID=197043 RepID=UPI001EEB8695